MDEELIRLILGEQNQSDAGMSFAPPKEDDGGGIGSFIARNLFDPIDNYTSDAARMIGVTPQGARETIARAVNSNGRIAGVSTNPLRWLGYDPHVSPDDIQALGRKTKSGDYVGAAEDAGSAIWNNNPIGTATLLAGPVVKGAVAAKSAASPVLGKLAQLAAQNPRLASVLSTLGIGAGIEAMTNGEDDSLDLVQAEPTKIEQQSDDISSTAGLVSAIRNYKAAGPEDGGIARLIDDHFGPGTKGNYSKSAKGTQARADEAYGNVLKDPASEARLRLAEIQAGAKRSEATAKSAAALRKEHRNTALKLAQAALGDPLGGTAKLLKVTAKDTPEEVEKKAQAYAAKHLGLMSDESETEGEAATELVKGEEGAKKKPDDGGSELAGTLAGAAGLAAAALILKKSGASKKLLEQVKKLRGGAGAADDAMKAGAKSAASNLRDEVGDIAGFNVKRDAVRKANPRPGTYGDPMSPSVEVLSEKPFTMGDFSWEQSIPKGTGAAVREARRSPVEEVLQLLEGKTSPRALETARSGQKLLPGGRPPTPELEKIMEGVKRGKIDQAAIAEFLKKSGWERYLSRTGQ